MKRLWSRPRPRHESTAAAAARTRRVPLLHILFAIAFTLAVVALLPPLRSHVEPAFRSGEVADRDVVAPFAFRVPLSGEEVRVARARAALAVLPVFERRRDVERDLTNGLSALLDTVATSVYAKALSLIHISEPTRLLSISY